MQFSFFETILSLKLFARRMEVRHWKSLWKLATEISACCCMHTNTWRKIDRRTHHFDAVVARENILRHWRHQRTPCLAAAVALVVVLPMFFTQKAMQKPTQNHHEPSRFSERVLHPAYIFTRRHRENQRLNIFCIASTFRKTKQKWKRENYSIIYLNVDIDISWWTYYEC